MKGLKRIKRIEDSYVASDHGIEKEKAPEEI